MKLLSVDCFKRKLLMASVSTTYIGTFHHLAEDPFGMASQNVDMFSAEEIRVSQVQNWKYENFKI